MSPAPKKKMAEAQRLRYARARLAKGLEESLDATVIKAESLPMNSKQRALLMDKAEKIRLELRAVSH